VTTSLFLKPVGRNGDAVLYHHLDDEGRKIGIVQLLASGTWIAALDSSNVTAQAASLNELRDRMQALSRDAEDRRSRWRPRWPWTQKQRAAGGR